MNLVKAQAVANDLPISELQKYANGFNPDMIPPWVAAGVMQEKMATQQKLANMQGAAQGEQPSVKEQIEQKAGLMALQQQMKQQSAGGMPPMGSMPVPEDAPQPEAQPEAFMAASGGLARLPVQFGFNGGGIVAFAEGGKAYETPYDRMNRKNREAEDAKQVIEMPAGTSQQEAAQVQMENPDAVVRVADSGKGWRDLAANQAALREGIAKALTYSSDKAAMDVPPQASYSNEGRRATPFKPAMDKPETMQGQGAGAPAPQAAPQAGLPGALPAGRSQTSPMQAEALQAIRGLPSTAPTPEEAVAQSNKMLPGVASEEAQRRMYEGQQKRISDLEAQYAKSRPSGLDDLIRVFGQAGQYKGLSGLGPAYTQNREAKRADELNFQAKMNALRADTEKDEQTGARDLFGKRSDLFKTGTEQFGQNIRAKAQNLANIYQVDQQAVNSMLSNATHMATARINADQKLNVLTPSQKAEIVNKAIDNVANELKGNPALMAQSMKDPGLRQRLVNQQVELLMKAAGGTTMAGAPGASGPGGTMSGWGKASVVK
jgi:hypothetical protein